MKNSFIPNKNNNYHPHFFREKIVSIVLVISLFLSLSIILINQNQTNGWLAQVISSSLVQNTNKERETLGLNQLKTNSMLTIAAQSKADDMAQKSYFSHTTPDGKKPWDFISETGYQFTNAGENLAINFIDSNKLHEAWMNSESHRKNILHKEFTEIGIGMSEGYLNGEPAVFVVQMFGRQKTSSNIFQTPTASASTLDKKQIANSSLIQTQTKKQLIIEPSFIELEDTNTKEISNNNIKGAETKIENIKTEAEIKNQNHDIVKTQDTQSIKIIKTFISIVNILPAALLFLIILSLGLLIGIELKKYNFKSIIYGLVMMTTVWGLVFINTFINERGVIF